MHRRKVSYTVRLQNVLYTKCIVYILTRLRRHFRRFKISHQCVSLPCTNHLAGIVDTLEDQCKSSFLQGSRSNRKSDLFTVWLLLHLWCTLASPYQLLSHTFNQRGETDVVALPVVIHVLHQLGDALCVSLWLELITFALLQKRENDFALQIGTMKTHQEILMKNICSPGISSGLCSWW